jgi:ATP-dependent DNA helicase DinG
MNYIEELSRTIILNDLKHHYDIEKLSQLSDFELNDFFNNHIISNSEEITMKDFYELDEELLIESLDGYVRVGEKIKKTNLECYTLTLVDNRKLSGAFNHLVETNRGWVKLKELTNSDYVLTVDGFIKVKNIRQIKTQDVYDLECLHPNHRYLSNGISNHNTGKSYAAIMIAEWYRNTYSTSAKTDIVTNTKILQDQYVKDFDFVANLKGKNNYWCRTHSTTCGDAQVLNKANNKKCNICPHKIAQNKFVKSPISLANFHLITSYSMYSPDMLNERKSKLLIIDEAHSFEETFCDFILSSYSEKTLKILDVWRDWMERDLDNISSLEELSNWTKDILVPLLAQKAEDLLEEAKTVRQKKKKIELIKKADHVDSSMCKYNRFVDDRENYKTNWTFEKDIDQWGKTRILVEPIWGNLYLKDLFWDEYDHVILMSGTLLDRELFSFIMGIDESDSTYLALPCPFDAQKRPVIYVKFGKMSYYEKKETFSRAVPIINKILEKNQEHKGIIHTSNYELSKWTQSSIKNKRLIFHDSATREKSLSDHLTSKLETVIVSPSMINGVDLKDDLSRFQIILKVPFPNLVSTKIKRRLETKPEWYNWKALIDLLQAYGRSIRNDEDWAETYILDECFDQILNNKKVPQYFLEALKIKKLPKK